MDNLYYNLWDSNCNETSSGDITTARFEPVTKSIYDPCPPGFCLPPNGAFTGFTEDGNTSTNHSKLNVSGSFDKGYHFRTVLKGESGGKTIFLPASGCRNAISGALYYVCDLGFLWSSVPYNTGSGCRLYLGSGYVYPLNNYYRAGSFVLRPVAEN